jgi:1-acyl-sn-glycerol-3-phosphate acyltransferase
MKLFIQFIRSLLFAVVITFWQLFYGATLMLMRPFTTLRFRLNYLATWGTLSSIITKVMVGIDYKVEGRENIPGSNVIVFSKHQSTWETNFLLTLFPQLTIILKRELLWIPIYGWGLAATGPIAINRGSGRASLKQINTQGKTRLEAGQSILCFPEGTRMMPGSKPDYKPGGAMLAATTGYPVVPVALNSGECWQKKTFLKKPGTITVSIGPAIETKGKKASKILKESQDWIEAKMQEINFTA